MDVAIIGNGEESADHREAPVHISGVIIKELSVMEVPGSEARTAPRNSLGGFTLLSDGDEQKETKAALGAEGRLSVRWCAPMTPSLLLL